jgi:hypothetical protein
MLALLLLLLVRQVIAAAAAASVFGALEAMQGLCWMSVV